MMDREATPPSPETGGEPIPAGFTLAEVEAWTAQRRSMLLAQLAGASPVPMTDADLAALRPAWARELEEDDIAVAEGSLSQRDAVLRRWGAWFAFWREWQMGTAPAAAADQRQALMELLARTPVVVRLQSGREVPLTNRSYTAAAAIGAHWLRIRLLHAEMAADAHDLAELMVQLEASTTRQQRAEVRRLMREVEAENQRRYNEVYYQRSRLYAHIFTPDGAPARDPENLRRSADGGSLLRRLRRGVRRVLVNLGIASQAPFRPWWEQGDPPPWWQEITPEDDAALLAGLKEAGPDRVEKLGNPPPRPGPNAQAPEDLGWLAVYSWMEANYPGLQPAALRDRDAWQTRAWLRAVVGAEPLVPEPGAAT